MAEVSNPTDKGETTASGTYGFGSPEPSRQVPDRNGDAVKSGTEENTHVIFGILDEEYTDNIRGQSPVTGLEFDFTAWEKTSIHPSWGDNLSAPSGAATNVGAWPLSAAPGPHAVDAGGEDTDRTGHKPGHEQDGERPV